MDRHLHALAEVISEGFMEIRGGCLAQSNAQLAQASGRSEGSLAGLKVAELFREEGDGLPRPEGPGTLECTLLTSDGRSRAVVCRRVFSEEGSEGWIVDDVTHARDVEGELLRAGQDLARTNRELTESLDRLGRERREREDLLSIVSHELRTPLTVIAGYTRLLLTEEVGPLNPEQRRFLEESRRSSQRLSGFITNILEAAHVEHHGEILEISNQPPGPVLEGVAEMFQPLYNERKLHLTLDIDTDVEVRFDPLRVEQILTNLLGNALKYVPENGNVDLTLRRYACSTGERRFVEIAVEDDGPGIAPEDRERVFEPYVQLVGRSATERREGLGLGLAICRRLVEAHGGEIHLTQPPGGGARFAFTLPVAAPSDGGGR